VLIWVLLAIAAQDAPELHLGRGYEAMKSDRFDEAATEFRAALKADPTLTTRARFPLAVALFEMKRNADARREFEAVRRETGDHPNVLYYLGRLDLLDQNFPAAIRNLTKAVAQPPFPDTAYQLGFACFKQGDLAAAEKWLKTAEQANPSDSAAPYQLGMLYRKQGREGEAKREFALSASLRDKGAEERQLRHDCEEKLTAGPRDAAREVCGRLYDANNPERLTLLGTLYGQHGDLEAALEPLKRAAELAPQSPQMQYNLAFTYFELNRLEEARVPIAKAVERWPDLFQLNSLYGALLVKMGRDAEAWPVLLRAHDLNAQDGRVADLLFGAAVRLGRASLAAGRRSEASAYYAEAVKLRPNDPETLAIKP
jgi:tetratricopeptide (TPR) repeat protein